MKTTTIEKLLRWAFMEELVKGGGVDGIGSPYSAWRSLEAVSCLGVRVDVDRNKGDFSTFIEQGDPHPDALLIGKAVKELDVEAIVLPNGWNPLSDWPEHERSLASNDIDRAIALYFSRTTCEKLRALIALIVRCAVVGLRPDSTAPVSNIKMEERSGKPCWFVKQKRIDALGRDITIEVDGYNQRVGRPVRGAYRKYCLSPSPFADILGRLDWFIWVKALEQLEARLKGQMQDFELKHLQIDCEPWLQKKFYNDNIMLG